MGTYPHDIVNMGWVGGLGGVNNIHPVPSWYVYTYVHIYVHIYMYNTHIHTHIPWTGWKPTENSKLETSFTVAIIYGILQYHLMISSFHKVCHGTGFLSCRRHHICTLAWGKWRNMEKKHQSSRRGSHKGTTARNISTHVPRWCSYRMNISSVLPDILICQNFKNV